MELKEFDVNGLPIGTIVVIRKLRQECGKIEVDKIISHLAHELYLGADFKIVVNNQVCEPKHISASRRIRKNSPHI